MVDHANDSNYGDLILLKGNEAVCEGAIWAGCRFFFGYPITPQNQIPEMMSRRLPQVGGTYLQAESEVAAINMVFGASSGGARVMTSSSSPGISLMQEGLSYLAGAELPCVVVNIQRGGPGLGNIAGAQSDYLQAVRGGHGDMFMPVYSPGSVQEVYDLVAEAFVTADKVRGPVMVLADAMLGQMTEAVRLRTDECPAALAKPWATTGCAGRDPNLVTSLYTQPADLERHNIDVRDRYDGMADELMRVEEYLTEDAEVLLVSYGISSRLCHTACELLREAGIRTGLFRPMVLRPFPEARLFELAKQVRLAVSVEMSLGQLVQDVRLAVEGRTRVTVLGRPGGTYSTAPEIMQFVMDELAGQPA